MPDVAKTGPARLSREYMAQAYNEPVGDGGRRERFMYQVPAEDLVDMDVGRRVALTPLGPLATILRLGASFGEVNRVVLDTTDADWILPADHIVYMAVPPAGPGSRGSERRTPTPLAERDRPSRLNR